MTEDRSNQDQTGTARPNRGPEAYRGGCLCGAIRYTVHGPLRSVVACHCSQCRRTSGHFVSATAADRADVEIAGAENIAWFHSSPQARRGFCTRCGSNLFWDGEGRPTLSIMAGTLDQPTGLKTVLHIAVADAGDYYAVPSDAPHQMGVKHSVGMPGNSDQA